MKFLLTGITGFAAPHLARLLIEDGHEVIGTYRISGVLSDRNPELDIQDTVSPMDIDLVEMDLTDDISVNKVFLDHNFDGVFHLAAFTHPPSSFETPVLALETNAIGTALICEGIRMHQKNCVLMQCSTPEVYGICPGDRKIDETTPMNPMNPYGVAKAAADMYVMERIRNGMIKGFLTRAFSHTGPRRRSNYSISSDAIQIARILKGKQDPVIKVGNLKAQRVVIDVRDVVSAYYGLMIKYITNDVAAGEIFHIAGNDLHEIGWYLDIMMGMFDVKAELVKDPRLYRKIDIPVQIPDSKKIRRVLGWEPKIEIEQTLEDIVSYWTDRV